MLFELKMMPVVADKVHAEGILICSIANLIRNCKYAVVDISQHNTNIGIELGLLLSSNIKVCLLKNKNGDVPTDIQGFKFEEYENEEDLYRRLMMWFRDNAPNDIEK